MKKLANTSFLYAMLGIAGGVFFREFTKLNGFSGRTNLAFVHVHLLVLGMVFFLAALLLEKQFSLTAYKHFGKFYALYNGGLAVTGITLVVRGVTQVLDIALSRGADASLSGVAGIGHTMITVALVLFFLGLRQRIAAQERESATV